MKLGPPLETIVGVFNAGNARGYHTEVKLVRFVLSRQWNAGAPVAILRKDTKLALGLADRARVRAHLGRAVFGYLERATRKDWARRDYSRLIEYLRRDPRP